ncbi:MAG: MlaD family protein, partial [Acidobacteriota bacterium]
EFNPFEKKFQLRARFADADGLREGAEVQLAGVKIGEVNSVNLLPPDNPDNAKVEAVLEVDQNLDGKPINQRIRTDSIAQLVATSLLANDKMINISPGSQKGVPIEENKVLDTTPAMSINKLTETGNELLEQINKLSVPANEILNKANQGEGTLGRVINDESLYKNLDTAVAETRTTVVKLQDTLDKVNHGNGSAGKLLNDPQLYNNLNSTVAQLESISRDLRAGRGSAGKFLSNDELYNETRAAVRDLRESVNSIKPALEQINRIAADVNSITTDLNAGKGTAGKLLKDEQLYNDARDSLAKFNSTASKLDILIGDAQNGKGTIGKLLTDETLYNNINQTTSNVNQITTEGTKLIYDFRQNPKKYLTIKFKLF